MRFGPRALTHGNAQGQIAVGEHLAAVVFHAPGFEQPRQIGTHARGHEDALGRARHQRIGVGVEEGDYFAAAHDVLVDGVKHLVGQVARMHEHDDIDVFVDAFVNLADAAHFVQLTDDVHDEPGLQHLLGSRIEAAVDIELGEQGHHGAFGIGRLGDELDEFVFEERFLVGPDQRHGFGNAQGFRRAFGQWLGRHEAEIDGFAALGDGNRLNAELVGEILVFGKRFGVDRRQRQASVARDHDFAEQFLHAGGVGSNLGHVLGRRIRIEECQLDRRLKVRDDVPGRGSQSEQAIFGQVQAPARQQGNHGDREQQGRCDQHQSDQ